MPTKVSKRLVQINVRYRDVSFIDDTDSPYSVLATDEMIHADPTLGIIDIDLEPGASIAPGRQITVRDQKGLADVNNITITPNGTDTINSGNQLALAVAWDCVVLEWDGVSDWAIVSTKG